MPLQRRLPKRGFTNIFRVDYQEVNVEALEALGSVEITPELLGEKGIARGKNRPIKILGKGEVTRAMTIRAHAFSRSAVEKIEKVGGTIEIIGTRKQIPKRPSAPAATKTESKDEQVKEDVQSEVGDREDSGKEDSEAGNQ